MSRRTKVIILAVFLVLLSIPVVYVVLTWHPQNPLRFTISASQSPPATGDIPPASKRGDEFYITVENTSLAVVRLYYAKTLDTPQSGGKLMPFNSEATEPKTVVSPGLNSNGYWIIPPRGSIRCAFTTMQGGGLRDIQGRDTSVHYTWRTQTTAHFRRCYMFIAQACPRSVLDSQWFARLDPAASVDVTPLHTAPASARSSD